MLGRHLSAAEFHFVLQNAGKHEEKSARCDKKLTLLDARNLYETRIGKFDASDVKTLDSEIRQYSDLPSWIDNNTEQSRGNNILIHISATLVSDAKEHASYGEITGSKADALMCGSAFSLTDPFFSARWLAREHYCTTT
ncbi:Rhodanese-like domain-containing protein 6 [Sesamum angolense]|uniref:Rhodanese-like domain-containing protein 6 n=1 Tax=Sesamum angolense TaxID=2727404 RepID=A0AAE2BTK7_9LAMI|nr:Rhodanese-like domain-containing protein 6 [Sesamum angolense]